MDFRDYLGEGFFWELVTLIDVMLLGHWLEMQWGVGAFRSTGNASISQRRV